MRVLTGFPVSILLLCGLRGVIVISAVFEGHRIVGAFICQSLTQAFVLLLWGNKNTNKKI